MRDFRETIQRHGVEMLCHGVVNLGDMLQVGWDYYNSWVWGCCANRAFEKEYVIFQPSRFNGCVRNPL